ncbi:hypothetical protein [Micromonospora tulbaghiae]|uniref:hypothetical protein n=1 Tax=Micromonospora tulbaghiae TaxID=479978 RepID=UPI00341E084E
MVTRLDPEQVDRNERGIAACRAALTAAAAQRTAPEEEARPLTRSEEIHAAALAEAARRRDILDRLRHQTPAHRRSQP